MHTAIQLSNYLIDAVIDNDVGRVNELLNEGADPNCSTDEAMITPLHFAAQHNSLEVIPLLVEAGAYIDAGTEPDDITPIQIAIEHDNHRVVQLLSAYYNEALHYTH